MIDCHEILRKASLASLMKEHVLRLAKSARCNIFSHLVSFSYKGERLISGLRRKDWILRDLIVLSSKREIYLARWKLMLTSDQAKAKTPWPEAPCPLFNR